MGVHARHKRALTISGSIENDAPARRRVPRSLTSLSLEAERGDVGGVVLGTAAEDGGPCDENVCAGIDGKSGCLRCDSAIHFQVNIAPASGDSLCRRLDFLQLAVDEFLAAETGVD